MIDLTSAGPKDATARFMRSFRASASHGPYLNNTSERIR